MIVTQAWARDTEIPAGIQVQIDSVKQWASDNGLEYEMLEFDGKDNPSLESNEFRMRRALDNPEMLWVDCDVTFNAPLPDLKEGFTPGKPFFSKLSKISVCVGIFYVNNCTSFFEKFWKEQERRQVPMTNLNWTSKILNRWYFRVEEFPAIYTHTFHTMGA